MLRYLLFSILAHFLYQIAVQTIILKEHDNQQTWMYMYLMVDLALAKAGLSEDNASVAGEANRERPHYNY